MMVNMGFSMFVVVEGWSASRCCGGLVTRIEIRPGIQKRVTHTVQDATMELGVSQP
jgi:hypothetical protein